MGAWLDYRIPKTELEGIAARIMHSAEFRQFDYAKLTKPANDAAKTKVQTALLGMMGQVILQYGSITAFFDAAIEHADLKPLFAQALSWAFLMRYVDQDGLGRSVKDRYERMESELKTALGAIKNVAGVVMQVTTVTDSQPVAYGGTSIVDAWD